MYKTMVNHFRDDECMLPNKMTFNRSDFLDLVEKRGSAEISFGSHLQLIEINSQGTVFENHPKRHICIFSILAFSTNFRIKINLSGNSVWPQALGFQKLAKLDHFWHFLMDFCPLKM